MKTIKRPTYLFLTLALIAAVMPAAAAPTAAGNQPALDVLARLKASLAKARAFMETIMTDAHPGAGLTIAPGRSIAKIGAEVQPVGEAAPPEDEGSGPTPQAGTPES